MLRLFLDLDRFKKEKQRDGQKKEKEKEKEKRGENLGTKKVELKKQGDKMEIEEISNFDNFKGLFLD